jgi:putative hydroxymethylpyrimidine transport system substrate-binding protein
VDPPPERSRVVIARRGGCRRALVVAAALVPALVLGACGAKHDVIASSTPRPLSVMLDFFPNADHSALYTGLAHGDFSAAGLAVSPRVPSDPSQPLSLLAAGKVDMAISYEPEVLLARDRGLKLVSVAALVQRPLTSLIALPSAHVRRLADLTGRRVGTAGITYQTVELQSILRGAGVDPARVQQVNVGFNLVPAMLSGQVAATLGGFWNYEAIQLEMAHRNPLVIPVDQAGVPTYDELVLVVRRSEAQHGGQDIRAFLHALSLGEQQVRADPAAAAGLLVHANSSLDQHLQLASIQRTLPAAVPAGAQPFGWQAPAAWASFGRWMFAKGLLHADPTRGPPPFTNEFLPGQGL